MVVLAVSVLAAMTYGHENCRVFSPTRSIDLYFVSYGEFGELINGEFGELIMKLLRAALPAAICLYARGALPEKS